MRKILNYFTGVIITFLFLIFNELIESMKKNKSAKVLLQENICMISTFMILLILRIGLLSQECKFVIAGVVVCYIIISIIYNHKKKVEI